MKGYNSHGCSSTLKEIYEVEVIERGNSTFQDIDNIYIEENKDKKVIWVTLNPYDAFKYSINASEYYLTEREIQEKYPHFMEEIFIFDIHEDKIILGNDEIGYLVYV